VEARIVLVGDPFFLARHRPLIDALRSRAPRVDEVSVRERALVRKIVYLARETVAGRVWPPGRAAVRDALQRFRKEPATFDRLSQRAARQLAKVPPGEFVLQLFSMSSPVTRAFVRPYAHYIDMTMAQVRRQWPPWAPFASDDLYQAWIAREGATYRGAERVFTFSEAARRSVIADYGADPERVVTVGAAGHYTDAAAEKRPYGTRSIVFNGSDFERKGGDRVLAAFRLVRERFPDATLTVVAAPGLAPEPGVTVAGTLGRERLFALFDTTDIVLAPTRLDSLAGFVLEAMSRGVVPVLSDAEAMDELVKNGCEGYVVSPPTPELLANHIATLFDDAALLERYGCAAKERVTRDLNWNAVAERILASLAQGSLP
jgi:glycogen(starch) synthase